MTLMCLAESPPTEAVAPDPSTSTVLGLQYHVWHCEGDGNCFYRAASKALWNDDGEGHALLRELIKDWTIVNQLRVEPYFTDEQLAAESVEQRAHRVGRLGEFADQPEVMAVSHMMSRSFLIHDVDTGAIYNLGQEQEDGHDPI